ncbi:MAG: hypothetical protein ACYDCH_00505 [Gaiellaceae bacterium]
MKRLILVSALAAVAAAGVVSGASGAVIEPTPQAAALAATQKFVLHDIHAWNRPLRYTLGTCRVLFRRPWVAYGCQYRIHGLPSECLDLLTVAVKRLAGGRYRAEAVKWRDLPSSAPC